MASVDEFTREKIILTTLTTDGHVSVKDLSERFGVSTVTIRKDLELLERRSLLRRVRGGAISLGATDEGAFEMRLMHAQAAKVAISRAAAQVIRDGDVIALDSSTTTYYLAQEIVGRRDLVVITPGLRHAMLLMEHSTARVLMPGGVIRRASASLVGPIGDVLAGRGRIKHGFFGVVAVSTMHGLMDISVEEAQTKRFLSEACDQVYGLFDSSKLDGFGLHSFADVGRIAGMYTDDQAAATHRREWLSENIPLHVVSTGAGPLLGELDPVRSPRPHRRRA